MQRKMDEVTLYIEDCKKLIEDQRKKNLIMMSVSFLLALVLCFLFMTWYQGENYNRIVGQNMNYIQDSAIQETNQIERDLDKVVNQIANFSKQYSILMEMNKGASVRDNLTIITDKSLFDRVGFITPDGRDVTLEGETNVSDRDYFNRGLSGEKGYEFLSASRVTGRSSMVFFAPVYSGDEIVGVMLGFYEMDRLDGLFSYQLFNYSPRTYLLDEGGVVIASSDGDMLLDNQIDTLAEKNYIGDADFETIKHAIADDTRFSITFSFVEGGKTSVGVISEFKDSNWMILSILPDSVTTEMMSGATGAGVLLLVMVSVTFIAMMVIFISVMSKHNKRIVSRMDSNTESFEATIEHDQKQSLVIESLANVYASIYDIDVDTKIYERFTDNPTVNITTGRTGAWEPNFRVYLDKYIGEDYREELEIFLDIDKVVEKLSSGDAVNVEYQRIDKKWRRATMAPAKKDENGNIKSLVFAVQVIELEKKKEYDAKIALQDAYKAAQLANEAKTTFLSNMSHDIRTPMNGIVGMTAIAAANIENTEKVSDCLKKITASSKHLLALINEVLDMSKIESGKVDLSEEEFSISEVIDDLITINQPLIKEKGHTLVVKTNNVEHENVTGDRTRLQQVFTNLLTNAIKYTPNGGKIVVNVAEKTTNKPTVGWYEVTISDNGIGMSEEFQKNMFEPFSRAEDNRIKSIQGTGLGMPIARNIIRMMNGDITVKSKIDEGSTFTVTFALKLRSEDERILNFAGLQVLVVDDDETACESACMMLDSLSMKSEWVTSGREAVKRIAERHKAQNDYYTVIVDWKMPDMDGVKTITEIRRLLGRDMPVVVMSSYDWTDVEKEARAAGADAFLSKPLFKSKLVGLFSELASIGKQTDITEHQDTIDTLEIKGKRILLAEDNEINREIAVEILTMMGLEIDTVENGKVCLERFTASSADEYDLIFMDIQMPVMNGYEAASAIRASAHPRAATIPIIAMTANAFSTDVRAAFDAGMNGHVSKPIDVNVIADTLEKYLKDQG